MEHAQTVHTALVTLLAHTGGVTRRRPKQTAGRQTGVPPGGSNTVGLDGLPHERQRRRYVHGAEAVREAIASTITDLPERLVTPQPVAHRQA
jgi:hypothetical protein